jgi:hypothetical protein
VVWNGGNEDQCTKYDTRRPDGCKPGSTNWYPNCDAIYRDCVAMYIGTVLQTAANCTGVPLWPVSPSAGWAAGVDTATGVATGKLVEKNDAVATPSRWNQGALDVHGPYGAARAPNSLLVGEGDVLFHSEFGDLSLPQFETLVDVLPDPSTWSVLTSAALAERSPNGAAHAASFVAGTFGPNLANFSAATEAAYRRVAYLTQVAQSEGLRTVVDGGRLGTAASLGTSGPLQRPWGYLFWQLNDVTQGYSWGSLEYGGRFKLAHYAARRWFAPLRIECNLIPAAPQATGTAPLPSTAPCTFLADTDFGGPGKAVPNTPTEAACCKVCQTDARCVVGVLSAGTCWMKYGGDNPVHRPGVVACKTSRVPTPVPQIVVCTASNDGPAPWSGPVTLAIDTMGAPRQAGVPSWSTTLAVGPVLPGHAVRFFRQAVTAATCPPSASGRGDTQGGPCWLYGGEGVDADRAVIGVPLQALSALVATRQLPVAVVTATVISTNETTATIDVTASTAAVALYVACTAAPRGQFSENGFHMLRGETRTITFTTWAEAGALDTTALAASLRVHWLNSAPLA